MNRREFFKLTGLVGAGLVIAPHIASATLKPKFQEVYNKVKETTEMYLTSYDAKRLGSLKFDGEELYRILYYLQYKPNVKVFAMDYPIQHKPYVNGDNVEMALLCTQTHPTDNVNKTIKTYVSRSKDKIVGIYTYTDKYVRIAIGDSRTCN